MYVLIMYCLGGWFIVHFIRLAYLDILNIIKFNHGLRCVMFYVGSESVNPWQNEICCATLILNVNMIDGDHDHGFGSANESWDTNLKKIIQTIHYQSDWYSNLTAYGFVHHHNDLFHLRFVYSGCWVFHNVPFALVTLYHLEHDRPFLPVHLTISKKSKIKMIKKMMKDWFVLLFDLTFSVSLVVEANKCKATTFASVAISGYVNISNFATSFKDTT